MNPEKMPDDVAPVISAWAEHHGFEVIADAPLTFQAGSYQVWPSNHFIRLAKMLMPDRCLIDAIREGRPGKADPSGLAGFYARVVDHAGHDHAPARTDRTS